MIISMAPWPLRSWTTFGGIRIIRKTVVMWDTSVGWPLCGSLQPSNSLILLRKNWYAAQVECANAYAIEIII
jgi:hypothetical protein